MKMKHLLNVRYVIAVLGLALCLPAISVAQTPVFKTQDASGTPQLAKPELIVRLSPRPGVPVPEAVVDAVNIGGPVPGGIGIGGPTHAEYLIPSRLTGRMETFYRENPDLPRARLERSVVLRYPTLEAAHGILTALQANPNVEFVELNRFIRFHGAGGVETEEAEQPDATPLPKLNIPALKGTTGIIPNDPFFAPPAGNNPTEYQWGSYAMRLPEAWEHVRGHAKVFVLDLGIRVDHEDLKAFGQSGPLSDAFIGGNFRGHLSYEYGDLSCTLLDTILGDRTWDPRHRDRGSNPGQRRRGRRGLLELPDRDGRASAARAEPTCRVSPPQ